MNFKKKQINKKFKNSNKMNEIKNNYKKEMKNERLESKIRRFKI